jgi:hypothetical protein
VDSVESDMVKYGRDIEVSCSWRVMSGRGICLNMEGKEGNGRIMVMSVGATCSLLKYIERKGNIIIEGHVRY